MDLSAITAKQMLSAAAVFALVLSLWFVVVLIISMRREVRRIKVENRLGIGTVGPEGTRVLTLWHDGVEATTIVPGLRHMPLMQRLHTLPDAMGVNIPAQSIVLGIIGAVLVTFVMTLAIFNSYITALGISGAVLAVFWFVIQGRIAARAALFETQLVDALDLIARSLRAGHPLLGAAQLVSEELAAPISTIFANICQQQSMGLSLEDAMEHAAAETASDDLKLFTTSVTIQLRSGGNLADMVERLADVIRERMRLGRRLRVLTTQTQFSKRVLLVMPIFVFILLNALRPDYMETLYSDFYGKCMLGLSAGMLFIGSYIMNKMAKLRY